VRVLPEALITNNGLPGSKRFLEEPFGKMSRIRRAPVPHALDVTHIFFVIAQLGEDRVDRMAVQVDDALDVLCRQINVVPVVASEVLRIRIEKHSAQTWLFEVELHDHAQPVASGPWEANEPREVSVLEKMV